MPSQRDRVLLGLLAYAGLRPEEALALRWIDVGRVLVIDRAFTHGEEKGTKTNQRRTVEVIKPLAMDLQGLRAQNGGEGLVAASETGGHLHLGNWRNRVWNPACRRAGVEATPYDGRHSYASLLIHAGRSPLAVAAAHGHASGETTWKHYAHVFEEARLASSTPVEDVILPARLRIGGPDRLHESCTEEVLDPSDLSRPALEIRPAAGKKPSTRGRIRTCDLWLRRPALYPLSYARESG
jgi:integrase